jgi:hypothetical protein
MVIPGALVALLHLYLCRPLREPMAAERATALEA